MDAGRGGMPRFYPPFPRMNIPGNMPFPGPMRPPNFPTYNRSYFRNHIYFADNPEVQGTSFWAGAFDQREPAINRQQTIPKKNKKAKQKAAAPPQEAPPAEETKVVWKKSRRKNKKMKLKLLAKKYGIVGPPEPHRPKQTVVSQPQNPGGAAKSPQPPIPAVGSQPQNPGELTLPVFALSSPWSVGAAKNPQQPLPTVGNQPQNPGGAVNNPQQPMATVGSQPQNPGDAANNPQQTTLPSVSQPANAEDKHQEQTGTQNGDLKRPREAEKTTDADVPTPPDKKVKTDPSTHRPNFEWRGDTSTMFSCKLCQYFTHAEQEIRKHLLTYQHKEILKHLSRFYPRDRVDFIHEYLVFRTKQISMEKKRKNIQPFNDTFKGIGPEHCIHRVQAAYCQICDVVIPDLPHNVITHVRSDDHSQKCKGQNPFKDTEIYYPPDAPGNSKQASSPDDVLVAEEDDDSDDDEDKKDGDSNKEDATADGGAGQEVPDHHNERPGIGPEHFIHRIQAAYCQICDVGILDLAHNVITHVRSYDHSRKRKATVKDTKTSSIMAAKDLLTDKDLVQRWKLYNNGQNPFKDTEIYHPPDAPGNSKQASSPDDVLVAEEDDDEDKSDGDTNKEDATADGGAGQEVPDHHNERPGNDIKDSSSKVVLPFVPETMGPDASSIPETEERVKEEEIEEEAEAAEAP